MEVDARFLANRLRETQDLVAPFFKLNAADQARAYAPGKWTVRQLLAHLADCEMVNLWRFCRAAAEPRSPVESFEQDDWARNLDYSRRPADVSGGLFLGARRTLIHFVEDLPRERLLTGCLHPEKGEFAAWRWLRLASNHCVHHHGQIEAALAGRPWVNAPTEDSWEFGGVRPPPRDTTR